MQVTGRTLITGSADGTVRFWDIETAQSLNVLDMVRPPRKGRAALSPTVTFVL